MGEKKNIVDSNNYRDSNKNITKNKSSKNIKFNISTRSTNLPSSNDNSLRNLSVNYNKVKNIPTSLMSIDENSFNDSYPLTPSLSMEKMPSIDRSSSKDFSRQGCKVFNQNIRVVNSKNIYESPSLKRVSLVNLMPNNSVMSNFKSKGNKRPRSIIKLEPIKESQTSKIVNKSRRGSNYGLNVNKKLGNIKLDPIFDFN